MPHISTNLLVHVIICSSKKIITKLNRGRVGYLPKSSLALDYLPKVDYTLVFFCLRVTIHWLITQ
jgi:hypothetical protein